MDFPAIIYFDTNIISSLTLGNPQPEFLELAQLAQQISKPAGIKLSIPQVVSLEWLNDHWEAYKKKSSQIKSNLQDIEQLTDIRQHTFYSPTDEFEQVSKTYKKKLDSLGIAVTDTPKNISIDELLIMAAFKIKPFEEKGEKGFRDAI